MVKFQCHVEVVVKSYGQNTVVCVYIIYTYTHVPRLAMLVVNLCPHCLARCGSCIVDSLHVCEPGQGGRQAEWAAIKMIHCL